ncbi:MAG: argininosuccinate lyase [Pyrinomonadaceae bacterium]
MSDKKNLWGGRFTGGTDEKFYNFNRSFDFDRRLFEADIKGCIGHCRGLENAGVLTPEESAAIGDGLNGLLDKAASESDFFSDDSAEDVHSFIETNLIEMIGDAGRKLHTGRSRNDQVATALRIWMRESLDELSAVLRQFQTDLLDLADSNAEAIIPGYTHLQRAQPVLFAHWCLAYFEMFRRDGQRLLEVRARVNVMPLGSAALAGTSYPIDRDEIAKDLGFSEVSRNSLDAVADRDFCADFVFAASIIMTHLSRLAEDVILYCTKEFGFFELSDKVATGSSLMPQKKNPDSMELVRGKTARVFGDLISLLTMIKGLPMAYNKDMQEDKEAVFDAFDTVYACLEVSSIVLRNITINTKTTLEAASTGYLNATELADYLSRKGVSFRNAHEIAGKIVLSAIEKGVELEDLTLDEMKIYSEVIEDDVFPALSIGETLKTKNVKGGTALNRVEAAIKEAKEYLRDQIPQQKN